MKVHNSVQVRNTQRAKDTTTDPQKTTSCSLELSIFLCTTLYLHHTTRDTFPTICELLGRERFTRVFGNLLFFK